MNSMQGRKCPICKGAGWHYVAWGDLAGVEPPAPRKVKCSQCDGLDGTEPTARDELELLYVEACEERDHLRAVVATYVAAAKKVREEGA